MNTDRIIQIFSVGAVELIVALVILFIAKKVRDVLTPFDDDMELFERDNPALGVATAGYYLGVIIAITGVLSGVSQGIVIDVRDTFVYGLLAIAFLNIARVVTDTFLLSRFRINDELIRDRNVGTGWVMCGVYFATGMIVRGALTGESATILSGITSSSYYFALGQIVLIIAAGAYQWLTSYDIHAEIENDNVAAGLALGGFIAALGVVVGSAASGSLGVNVADTISFGVWAVAGITVLAFARLIADHILVPGHSLSSEIAQDKNQAAASILAVSYQAIAWMFILAV